MPPAVRLEIFAQGTKQWSRSLRGMSFAARHPRPFFKSEITPDMERIEQAIFSSQGRRGGGSWKGLSPETVLTKVRKVQDPRINIAEGNLLYSLEDSDAPNAIRRVTGFKLTFGSSAPGAAESQKYRPIVRFTKYDLRRWGIWWMRYIARYGRRV